MVNRKYIAEGALNLFSSGATVIQPTDIYHLSKNEDVREALKGCNLYCIVKRQRVSIASDSLNVVNGKIQGHFKVQSGHDYERFPFSSNQVLADYITDIQVSEYPQDGIHFVAYNGESTKMPIFRFMCDCEYDLDGNDDLEVLYIGQGYGQEGERLALDRLCSHSTLQRILADTLHESPDQEILLLLFRYEHYRKILSSEGDFSVTPTATEEEEIKNFSNVQEAEFARKNRISLAEAALIRYFEPKYNKIYKTTFPSKKHKVIDDLIEQDFSGLSVEIDTSNIRTKLFSGSSKPNNELFAKLHPFVHIANIPLYSQEERESFLHHHL